MKTHNYLNLTIWKESIDLAVIIYKRTEQLNHNEKYGLVSQIRRAAYSIPSNIAEGSKRTSDKDFNRFLGIAQGSLAELHTQLIIFYRIEKISNEFLKDIEKIIELLRNKIYKFQKRLLK